MISVILIEPSVPGNIGAVARVMANFGFDELVLVSPKCDHLSEEAQGRSKHARNILRAAKVVHALPKLDYLIATTSALGTDSNIPRSPVSPKELVSLLEGKMNGRIGLVFGPEGPGLTNAQIDKCDFVVTIPTHKKYHSMNISHAVAIVLYELFDAYGETKVAEDIKPITPAERRVALKYIDEILERYAFRTDTKRETQRLLWRRIVGKLFMSKRESYALLGFLRQVLKGPK
ncbi:RNA methyltransferase [Candidatus Woesearchaeota archaeon]|nr:RNA methyltransferase [Candidatus Woesearchaeota archaeon]